MLKKARKDLADKINRNASALVILGGLIVFLVGSWWSYLNWQRPENAYMTIQGTVAGYTYQGGRTDNKARMAKSARLYIRLNESPLEFYLPKTGVTEDFYRLADSLKPGSLVTFWVNPKTRPDKPRSRPLCQAVVDGQTVFPLSSWRNHFRLLFFILAALSFFSLLGAVYTIWSGPEDNQVNKK